MSFSCVSASTQSIAGSVYIDMTDLESCEDNMSLADESNHHTTLFHCFLSIFDLEDTALRRAASVSGLVGMLIGRYLQCD